MKSKITDLVLKFFEISKFDSKKLKGIKKTNEKIT